MKKTRKWRVLRDVNGVFIFDKSRFHCELLGARYLPDWKRKRVVICLDVRLIILSIKLNYNWQPTVPEQSHKSHVHFPLYIMLIFYFLSG